MVGQTLQIRGVTYFALDSLPESANIVPHATPMPTTSSDAAAQPTILCLHGFTGTHAIWHAFIRHFDGTAFRIIAPDLLGHGATSAPTDESRYAMSETVADLLNLLDELGCAECICLGYSMGGRIALSLAHAAPERVHALILESASPGLETLDDQRDRVRHDRALADRIEQIGVVDFAIEWAQVPLFHTQKSLPASVWEGQQAIRRQHSAAGLAGSLRGVGTGVQPSLWGELTNISMPVCLITGELDVKFTRIADRMRDELPCAEHIIVPGAGHTVHLERAEQFVATVDNFLVQTSQ